MNPADLEGLRQAVLGAQNFQAPPSSLGASQAPELAQLYATDFQLPASTAASGALAQGTGDLLKAQASSGSGGGGSGGRRSGGSNYVKYAKADGGFGFRDPNGNEISAYDYAKGTGIDPAKVLSGSKNPIDKAFAKDWKQLDQYMRDKQAAQTDAKARSRAQAVETQVRKLYNIPLHQQSIDSVVNTFMQAYPTVFGGNTTGKQGTNTLLSAPKQKKSSPYGGLGAGRL